MVFRWLLYLFALAMFGWLTVSCGSDTPDRQDQVAELGSEVMPFDLDRTTHIFEKLDKGGLQQVVSNDGDSEQIALIRAHLADEAERFSQGDFLDPMKIHGENMAGLDALMEGADRLAVVYSDVQSGGQILYTAKDDDLIMALHAWFDQQLVDHGEHAQAVRPDTAEAVTGDPQSGMGMGMMGNNSMHTAHHAAIPEAYAGLSNPVVAGKDSLERGAEIYNSTCAICHGDGGMGDGPGSANLDPAVSPIAHTSQMLSDAYLFWRISEGGQGDPFRSAMPSWKGTLDEQARWDVINYVQALGRGTMQPQRIMGGTAYDPAVEQQNRKEMLAKALQSGLINQGEANIFEEVHTALDSLMVETGLRMQGNNLPALLAILVDRAEISQKQADTFTAVHDGLMAAGLMH
jgi:mono/diheme cytochrome c family protein